jgi:hypothetical protein
LQIPPLNKAAARYTAAVELLGERDEKLEELKADLQDVKELYKDQIEFMVAQLTALHSAGVTPPPQPEQQSL